MAKAILLRLVEGLNVGYDLHVEALGLGQSRKRQASRNARRAIEEMFGEDLLANHHPRTITRRLAQDADLILVMEEKLLNPKVLPPEKTFALKAYFGLPGHVQDPWPDRGDEASMSRYRNCCQELRTILESNPPPAHRGLEGREIPAITVAAGSLPLPAALRKFRVRSKPGHSGAFFTAVSPGARVRIDTNATAPDASACDCLRPFHSRRHRSSMEMARRGFGDSYAYCAKCGNAKKRTGPSTMRVLLAAASPLNQHSFAGSMRLAAA
jgi:protein-tyrosine-phosphatase